jgi:Spy/CpxP family protein refolding chaperone
MFRRLAAVTLAAVLSAGGAAAQNPPGGGPGQGGPGGMMQRRVQMLLQGITVTPAQQARIDTIIQQTMAQMPPMTPGTPPDSATRALRRALSMRQDSTIRAMLTPEQQQVWDRNAAAMPQPGRRPGM